MEMEIDVHYVVRYYCVCFNNNIRCIIITAKLLSRVVNGKKKITKLAVFFFQIGKYF